MRYILAYINTEIRTYTYDKEFASMKELMTFVEGLKAEWTSFSVTVLPAKAKKKAVLRKRSPRFMGSM